MVPAPARTGTRVNLVEALKQGGRSAETKQKSPNSSLIQPNPASSSLFERGKEGLPKRPVFPPFSASFHLFPHPQKGWGVGSLITRRRANAMAIGSAVHAFSAVVFAMLYLSLMLKFGFTRVASSLPAGIGFGLVHGVVVSLFLLLAVAAQHPLAEFRNPGLGVVLSHLAGHVAAFKGAQGPRYDMSGAVGIE